MQDLNEENDSEKELTTSTNNKKRIFQSTWSDPESRKYKPWAIKSEKGEKYVKCTYCDTDVLVDSLYGSNGHLNTKYHVKKE